MRAACFQFDVTRDVELNVASVERGLRRARDQGADLVVVPEMWPTSFAAAEDDVEVLLSATQSALGHVTNLARELDVAVCGSAFGRTGSLPANRWALVDGGIERAAYDKVHLFRPTAEDESFSAGAKPSPVVECRGARVGGLVCYDLRFPDVARSLFRARADVIAVSAQWPSARLSHWRALCIGRAVEAQAFVVACNRVGTAVIGRRAMTLEFPGASLVVDPDGRVLAEGGGTEELVTAEIDLELARKLRVRVPVEKDERRDLFAGW